MDIDLQPHPLGVLLPVRAQPGAKRNAVLGAYQGMLKVAVTAAPEKGKANQAVIEVLARALGIKRSQIDCVAGQTSQQKKLLLQGVSLEEANAAIAAALASAD